MVDLNNKEFNLSPYKLGLLLLLETHLDQAENNDQLTQNEENDCSLLLAIIDLIHIPDLDLKSLLKTVQIKADITFVKNFKERLKAQYEGNLHKIFFTMEQLIYIFFTRYGVHRSSFIGLFVRRLFLTFEKLLFHQIVDLFEKFSYEYLALITEEVEVGLNLQNKDSIKIMLPKVLSLETGNNINIDFGDRSKTSNLFSQKQTEYFIAQQVKFLIHEESAALNPQDLSKCIKELNSSNISEMHFLTFLNYLRIHEYGKASISLHKYFDCKKQINLSIKEEDKASQSAYTYAPLLLVNFRYRFKLWHPDSLALREVVRISQENNDIICLQHALGWLSRINIDFRNARYMLIKLIGTSSNFPLPYLTSLAYQILTKNYFNSSAKPHDVFSCIEMSKSSNNEALMKDTNSISLILKSSTWNAFGIKEMLRLNCQILLNLKSMNSLLYLNEEAECITLSYMAILIYDEGYFDESIFVLELARKKFPQKTTNYSHYWSFAELWIRFHDSLYENKMSIAEKWANNMQHISIGESIYCKSLSLFYSNELSNSLQFVNNLIEYCKKQSQSILPLRILYLKSLLLKADILCASGQYMLAMIQCIEALNFSRKCHFITMEALSIMHIAQIQLNSNKQFTALKNLEIVMHVIFTNSSKFDRARFRVLRCQCMLATATSQQLPKVMEICITLITDSIKDFEDLKAFNCVTDLLCLLHVLYVELGNGVLANTTAFKYKELRSLYSNNSFSILF